MGGEKGRYTSLLLINIHIIQIDMLEMICTQKRNEGRLHGKISRYILDYLSTLHHAFIATLSTYANASI